MSPFAVSDPSLARRIRWLLQAAALVVAVGVAAAEEPRRPDAAFDKLVIDTLRDVHNFGAEFYNRAGDPAATFRIYQGALMTIRPLLGHRPQVQKFIEQSLAEVDQEPTVAHKAYRLHVVIEEVRSQLRKSADAAKTPAPKAGNPETPKGEKGVPKKEAESPDKTHNKEAGLPKKEATVPNKEAKGPAKEATPAEAPPPRSVPIRPVPIRPDVPLEPPQPPPPVSSDRPAVSGRVSLRGQPLASGTILWVSLDLSAPRVFAATVEAGQYRIAGPLPAGRYAVIVQGPGVPEKYQLTTSSGQRVTVSAAAAVQDFALE